MARGDKRTTQREDVSLAQDRPTQLQTSKRFFSNQGNDQATRQARALQTAFGVGEKLVISELDRRNVAGGEQAAGEAASGGTRDEGIKNQGYNRAWDELDAEADVNFMKKELPEVLRGADWENLEEADVQSLISGYMQEQFEGVDPTSWYGQQITPALLAMEAETLATHRDMVVQKLQTEQRTAIFENLNARFDATLLNPDTPEGTFDYDYLGEQTNTFFDGGDKRTVYWETLYDFAIENGRPDLIEDAPERFASGDPTGINDPLLQDSHRQAINSATAQKAKAAAAEQAKVDAQNDAKIFDLQIAIADARAAGRNPDMFIEELKGVPGVDFATVATAKNHGATELDRREDRSADLSYTAPLWNQIYNGEAGPEAIFFSYQSGYLGEGPQAETTLRSMLTQARTVQNANKDPESRDPNVSVWRGQINRQYNAQLAGPLGAINPAMHQVNVSANAFYNEQVASGVEASEAFQKTSDRFDTLLKSIDMTDMTGITQPKPQSDFLKKHVVTTDAMKAVSTGKVSWLDAFAGVPTSVMVQEITEAYTTGTISEEEAAALAAYID